MKRNEDLEWFFRFAAAELGLRAMPIEPSGGRGDDGDCLTGKQRYAANKSSRIRTALAQLSGLDRFILDVCYRERPGCTMYVVDPAKNWIDLCAPAEQHDVEEARHTGRHESTLAKQARNVARRTRDAAGVSSALARAEAHDAAEARAKSRQTDAEILLRRAALRCGAEAERAQSRFEASASEVRATSGDLERFVHGKRTENCKVEVSARKTRRLLASVSKPVVAVADALMAIWNMTRELDGLCREEADGFGNDGTA